jgi:phosphatidylserine synthase
MLNKQPELFTTQVNKKNNKQDEASSKVFFGTPTSINAIFFASILLSSRLNKDSKVFTLLYISLVIFGFTPCIRHLIRHKLRFLYDTFALVSTLVLCYIIFSMNRLFGILYLVLIIFVSILSPLIFIYAYQFKNDIRGPWDCP